MKDSRVDFWDVENISTSFSYSEVKSNNINLATSESKQHRGNLTYNFSPKEISIQPFKKLKWLDSKYLKLIKDFKLYIYLQRTTKDLLYLQKYGLDLSV